MNRRLTRGISASMAVAGVLGLAVVGSVRSSTPMPMADGGGLGVGARPFVEREQFGTLELQTDPEGGLFVELNLAGNEPADNPERYDFSPRRSDKCLVDTGSSGVGEFLRLEVWDAIVAGGPPALDQPRDPQAVGLVSNGLGSREQNNCNRSNGRLEPGQAFVIELGSDPRFDDVVFDYGVLDVEGKFGTDLYAATTLAGTSTGVYEPDLGNASDNDSDAGGNDNDRVEIGQVPAGGGLSDDADDDFDQLVILPVNSTAGGDYFFDRGELSLEGGGDFADGTNRTVFNLVRSSAFEYSLVCWGEGNDLANPVDRDNPNEDGTIEYIEETPDELDWNIDTGALADSGYPARTRVFRYGGVDENGDPKPCDAIGADLSADTSGDSDDSVLFETSSDDVNLRVELTWVIPQSLANTTPDPFARQIDVDGDGPLLPADSQYCASFDGSDAFDPQNVGVADHLLDGVEVPWCALTDERTLVTIDGEDVVIQRMVWDGLGDPRWL